MNFFTFYRLHKIAAEAAPQYPAFTRDNILNALAFHETGYSGGDHQPYYTRTKIRQNSTAYGPWQITGTRAVDIAKHDPVFAKKLYNTRLAPMYSEMRRTGLGAADYAYYTKTGKLPKNFKGVYDKNYDYGGNPLTISKDEHELMRNAFGTFIDKQLLAKLDKQGITDPEQQWMKAAQWHYIGHTGKMSAREQAMFNQYWPEFKAHMTELMNMPQKSAASATPVVSEPEPAPATDSPAQPETAQQPQKPQYTPYTVEQGWSLWGKRNDPKFNPGKLPWAELQKAYSDANPGVNWNKIKPGQSLNIPQ